MKEIIVKVSCLCFGGTEGVSVGGCGTGEGRKQFYHLQFLEECER